MGALSILFVANFLISFCLSSADSFLQPHFFFTSLRPSPSVIHPSIHFPPTHFCLSLLSFSLSLSLSSITLRCNLPLFILFLVHNTISYSPVHPFIRTPPSPPLRPGSIPSPCPFLLSSLSCVLVILFVTPRR